MRIAIFSDTFLPQINGISSVVYQNANMLAERGHQVSVFTAARKNINGFKAVKPEKFEVVRIPSVPVPAYPGERLAMPTGMTILKARKFSPEIIHIHTPFSVGWEAIWSSKFLKVPIVGTHHTFFNHYLKHIKMDFEWTKEFSWKFVVAFYNRADLVLAPTKSLAEALEAHGLNKKPQILANPIDVDSFKPAVNRNAKKKLREKMGLKGKTFIYIGRVSYEKSIDHLLFAFAEVLKKIPESTLLIVGDGPERGKLEDLAREFGISKNVLFTGFRYDEALLETLEAGDIFVTASKSENMPVSILEAMSTGLPIVATATLGIPEVVKDNENGFLAPADNPKALAGAMIKLISDGTLMDKFAGRSRELALEYSKEKIATELENIYQKLLTKK